MQAYLIIALIGPIYGITNFADVKCGGSLVTMNPKVRAPRIVGGAEAIPGEFPWIVSLQYTSGENYVQHFCAGFLVTSRYVVTAAHCIHVLYDRSIVRERFNVIIGEHAIGDEETPFNAYAVGVESITMHPEFTSRDTTRNDIALIRLKDPVKWTESVQPACLPAINEPTATGQSTSVAGWGYTKATAEISKFLMTVDIPVVSTKKCEEDYEWIATERQLCAGSPSSEKGGCKGDSGSPLMAKVPNADMLSVVGIHSGGHGCGGHMGYGIYTRVASYVDWIKFNIKP